MLISELLTECVALLEDAEISNAKQEARWIIESVMDISPASLYMNLVKPVGAKQTDTIRAMVQRRCFCEPLQYILNEAHFRNLSLKVGPGVLIPRPETEMLVDLAIQAYKGGDVLDLCTGSGAIALALATELPNNPSVVAVDLSEDALDYAEFNRRNYDVQNVTYYLGDLLKPIPAQETFSLIVSNPPYISEDLFRLLPEDVKSHEPKTALFAEQEGKEIARRIIRETLPRLIPGGTLLCEVSSEQVEDLVRELTHAGYENAEGIHDQFNRPRFIKATRKYK